MAGDERDHRRDVSHNQFRDQNFINQGNIHGNVHYYLPHQPAPAEVVRVIPYPRNEDRVRRGDVIDRLDKLLPQTPGFHSAALWGLGGSGKTQIALDYAYRRCDNDSECCVFWVHADNEATFVSDYKTIGKKLRVDDRLDGSDLLDAVCSKIGERSKWVMILDNADDLGLFGYVPLTSQGILLWTSRDAHIAGTLVGSRRGIEVQSMAADEATTLLARVRDKESTFKEEGVDALLEELQRLPLAISQAGKTRWEVLKMSDSDRHRRPEVSNSMLEMWRISTERIRVESEMSYRILHMIAYIDSQDIPIVDKDSIRQTTDVKVQQVIIQLKEFSFLSLRREEDGGRSYKMHKLVQEAIRYGLRVRGPMETALGETAGRESGGENGEAYYSSIALRIVDDLFPVSEGKLWARCEQYMTHAIRVGERAEISRTGLDISGLLSRVSGFLYDQGRWREKEPIDERGRYNKAEDIYREVLDLRREVGRYDEAEEISVKVLDLQREVVGEKHPDTIRSMASLAATYYMQGRYGEAETLKDRTLDLQ
ncbi:P-loop containing nucleoside triphosphate hydrolase protein [Ilyonectria destructans]|nr:P-loop containing nucleoside triphosphate hydrolase protein [Ilyonectria destructans]